MDPSVDATDPLFPPANYPFCQQLDDHVPWQTNVRRFDRNLHYSQADQDAVTQAERQIFNATESMVATGFGLEKQLNSRQRPPPDVSFPPPVRDVAPQNLTAEPEESANASPSTGAVRLASPLISMSNSFGNLRFGSRYSNATTFTAFAPNRDLQFNTDVQISSTIFSAVSQIARFHLWASMNCGQQLHPPPVNPFLPEIAAIPFMMGQQLNARSWRQGFGRQTGLFHQNRRFFRARKTFMVGPVPLTVAAGVEGTTGLDLEGSLQCTGLDLNARPYADLSVWAEGSVNVRILQFGVHARLSLINVSMPSTAQMTWLSSSRCATWRTNVGRRISTLSGNVDLFTTVRFLFYRQRFDLTIASWNGLTWDDTIHNRNGELCPH